MKKENFEFKKRSHDFIVEEILPFEISGHGDVFFVRFEKINLNTMDVIDYLCDEYKTSKNSFGIGGLKDKDALARQRICVYKSLLNKNGGEVNFLKTLGKIVKISQYGRHDKTLNLSENIKNRFFIRLRGKKNFSQVEKDSIKNEILELMVNGAPNYFGSQRFGVNYRNIDMGKGILLSKKYLKNKFETKFKLQAYGSFLFNKFIDFRMQEGGNDILNGDIFRVGNKIGFYDSFSKKIKFFENKRNDKFFYFPDKVTSDKKITPENKDITIPLFGYNTLLCNINTDAGKIEQSFIKKFNINEKNLEVFKTLGIFGLRRAFWMYPEDTEITWKENDIIINFTLGKGNYASIVIDRLLTE